MDNIVVAIFNDDNSAIEGLRKLNELDQEGDVVVYNRVLLRKTPEGKFKYLKDETDLQGWNTLGGMALGGFVGLLGGPVGFVVGMMSGATVGAAADIGRYSFDREFLDAVDTIMPPGTTSLIAQVGEPDAAFIDTQLEPLGAVIFRSNIYAEQRQFVQAHVDTVDADIRATEDKMRKARAQDKAAFEAKLTELKNERDAKLAQIKAEIKAERDENKANLEILRGELTRKVDKAKRRLLRRRVAKYEATLAKDEAEIKRLNAEVAKASTAGAA